MAVHGLDALGLIVLAGEITSLVPSATVEKLSRESPGMCRIHSPVAGSTTRPAGGMLGAVRGVVLRRGDLMGFITWAADVIRSLVPRCAVESEEAEITEAVIIELDDSEEFDIAEAAPEASDDGDDSSFFGRSLVGRDDDKFSGRTVPLHDLFDEDDENVELEHRPESGYTTLSEEAARAFAKEQRGLSFDSLSTLSDKAAKALGQHRGDLALNRLTRLSAEIGRAHV